MIGRVLNVFGLFLDGMIVEGGLAENDVSMVVIGTLSALYFAVDTIRR